MEIAEPDQKIRGKAPLRRRKRSLVRKCDVDDAGRVSREDDILLQKIEFRLECGGIKSPSRVLDGSQERAVADRARARRLSESGAGIPTFFPAILELIRT